MTTGKTVKAAAFKGKSDFAIITIRDGEFQAMSKRFQPEVHAEGRRRYSITRVKLCLL